MDEDGIIREKRTIIQAKRREIEHKIRLLLKEYPDVYKAPGAGWCGPGRLEVTARMIPLTEALWELAKGGREVL